jgi:hypothetical protein
MIKKHSKNVKIEDTHCQEYLQILKSILFINIL